MSSHPVLPPPVYLFTAAAAQQVLTRGRRTSRLSTAVGVGVQLAAGLLAGVAFKRFDEHDTIVHPMHPEHATALVTDGPFRYSRNPMYVAMAAGLVGNAIRRRSVRALLPAVAFVAVVDRLQVRPEEDALSGLFGEEYDAYCDRTPRWISGPWA